MQRLEDSLTSIQNELERKILKIALAEGYVTPHRLNKRFPQRYPVIVAALRRLTQKGLLYKIDRGIYIPNCLAIMGITNGNCALINS